MAGLFEKDMRLILKRKQTLVMFVGIALLMGASIGGTFLVGYLTFLCTIFTMSTISCDEVDNGYSFLMTLPIDCKTYVIEKYGFCGISGLLAWILAVLLMFIGYSVKGTSFVLSEELSGAATMIPVFILMLDLMIPLELKFGIEKSRIALAALGGGIMVLAYAGKMITEETGTDIPAFLEKLDQMPMGVVFAVLALLAVVLTVISMLCSVKIMEHKEF